MNTDTTLLLHVNDYAEKVADVINGKPYTLPPFEPVEVPSFFAEAILSHIGHLFGIVKVRTEKTKTGISYMIDEAMEEAKTYLGQCEKEIVNLYVRQQMEDRISAGKPALPPTGIALSVIRYHKINLRVMYGLTPVGWSDGSDAPNTAAVAPIENRVVEALRAELAEQRERHADLSDKFDRLMAMIEGQQGQFQSEQPDPTMKPQLEPVS